MKAQFKNLIMPKPKIKKNFKISLVGPPLSGKGTQADKLSEYLHLPHYSMSQMIKHVAAKDKKIAQVVYPAMKAGQLIPTKELDLIQAKFLGRPSVIKRGFILDGAPRRLTEGKFLDKLVRLDVIISLKVSLSEVISRASGRRQCVCGMTYHLKYNPPKRPGICDVCGRKLFIREDDKPVVIRKRVKIYQEEMIKISRYFKASHKFIEVNGELSIEQVFKEMISKLKRYLVKICPVKQ